MNLSTDTFFSERQLIRPCFSDSFKLLKKSLSINFILYSVSEVYHKLSYKKYLKVRWMTAVWELFQNSLQNVFDGVHFKYNHE